MREMGMLAMGMDMYQAKGVAKQIHQPNMEENQGLLNDHHLL